MNLPEYLTQRRLEVEKEYLDSQSLAFLREGHKLLGRALLANYSEVTPDVVDKIRILEGMLFGFVENCFDVKLLERAQKSIAEAIEKYEGRDENTTLQ